MRSLEGRDGEEHGEPCADGCERTPVPANSAGEGRPLECDAQAGVSGGAGVRDAVSGLGWRHAPTVGRIPDYRKWLSTGRAHDWEKGQALELAEDAAAGALGAGALVVVLVPDELDPEEESDELEPELDEDSEEPELVPSDLDELAAGDALLFLSRESLR